jgi:hypothetical protein
MTKAITPPDDNYNIRCPRLGHQIPFSYCRFENQGLPCFKTLDCWHSHFPVEEYMEQELTADEWKMSFNGSPKPKLSSLVELIDKAKKSTQSSD